MTDFFTPDELAQLSAEIDRQLLPLGTPGMGLARGGTPEQAFPALQRRSSRPPARRHELPAALQAGRPPGPLRGGGVLYTQWQKWKDLTNKDLLQVIGAVLVGMGLSGGPLQVAAVAVAVYVLYLGVQAFCAEV